MKAIDSLYSELNSNIRSSLKNLENSLSKIESTDGAAFKKTFNLLSALHNNWKNEKEIKKSIEIGRFDKNDYSELENTIILGEDKVLYALINSIDSQSNDK